MSLRRALLLVGLAVAAWSAVGAAVPASYGAHATGDEPQYLLSALSLAEDRDLDIADERHERRYRVFHAAPLPVQERDGMSPHDPLLPALLAVPMGLGGWVAAKLTLSLAAGALAASMVWVAVRRLAVPLAVAVPTVLAFSLAAPLAPYGSQVYPEVPAALAVTLAVGVLTGPLGWRGVAWLGLLVTALPWLSVKYLPVAAVLAAAAVLRLGRRGDRRAAVALAGGWAVAGLAYVLGHELLYGGLTSYAAGDHFVGGEHTVVGSDPDFLGRSGRLLGLLVDRGFGLAAWHPAFLLAVPALVALVRRRPPSWAALAWPVAAGWLTATFVALTMHGWWWPGRQVVVVVPLLVLAIAWWVADTPAARPWLWSGAVLGLVLWGAVVVEGLLGRLTLVVDFESTANPLYRLWRLALPDYRHPGADDWALHGAWLVGLAAFALISSTSRRKKTHEDTRKAVVGAPAGAGGVR